MEVLTAQNPTPLSILGQMGNTVTNMCTQFVLQRGQVALRDPVQKYAGSSTRLVSEGSQ